jgi:hypothetical protein
MDAAEADVKDLGLGPGAIRPGGDTGLGVKGRSNVFSEPCEIFFPCLLSVLLF